jgi:Mn-containing catalase
VPFFNERSHQDLEVAMFLRTKRLQYPVRVERPDPVFARHVQELLGGKYGEMTVMMQYLSQGWALRGTESNPRLARIRDMLLDTATEEIAHVEMLSTMIARLLEGASPEQQLAAADASPAILAGLAGMNPQHVIASGLGPQLADCNGNPWNGSYVTASGNIVVDLYANANYEQNGRLQTARVYEMTDDPGVRDTLAFMLARDLMHQLQWLAAIDELGGPTAVLPVPSVPEHAMKGEYAYTFMSYAVDPADTTAGEGRWAHGPAPDGKGEFSYFAEPFAEGEEAPLPPAPEKVYDNLPGDPVGEVHPKQRPRRARSVAEKVGESLKGS